jgi:hypothetical protein
MGLGLNKTTGEHRERTPNRLSGPPRRD